MLFTQVCRFHSCHNKIADFEFVLINFVKSWFDDFYKWVTRKIRLKPLLVNLHIWSTWLILTLSDRNLTSLQKINTLSTRLVVRKQKIFNCRSLDVSPTFQKTKQVSSRNRNLTFTLRVRFVTLSNWINIWLMSVLILFSVKVIMTNINNSRIRLKKR